MGKVVKLEAPSQKESRPKRNRRSKAALVLGGGGFTAAVYEIGALRALDLLSVNRTINEFDIYVGTSAGSFVASLAANGVTPAEMMRVIDKETPTPFRDVDLGTLLKPNYRDWLLRAVLLPLRLAGITRTVLTNRGQVSLMDVLTGLAEAFPPGLYNGSGIDSYMEEIFSDSDRTNDFRLLDNELLLPTTDLDTCERIVLGEKGWDDVPISKAVAASAALPMVYKPVEMKGRQLVDGGVRSTTNVDIAVQRGAKFIIVVNPLVPYINDFKKQIPTIFGSRVRRVADMGFPQIGYQAFRLMAHSRLHELSRQWAERYPDVDIILIEPEPNDELMFGTSVMNFSNRVKIARHGFESVTLKLNREHQRYRKVCEKHGIEISARRVAKVVDKAEEQKEPTRAWRRILEQTTGSLLRQSGA